MKIQKIGTGPIFYYSGTFDGRARFEPSYRRALSFDDKSAVMVARHLRVLGFNVVITK